MASCNFLFIPPDRAPAGVSFFANNPTSWIILRTSALRSLPWRPLMLPKKLRCSSTVRLGNRTFCCGQMPVMVRISLSAAGMGWSYTVQSPSLIVVKPVIIAMTVLLPAPLCPIHAIHEKSQINKITSLMTLYNWVRTNLVDMLSVPLTSLC
jgi:hypothetical protein